MRNINAEAPGAILRPRRSCRRSVLSGGGDLVGLSFQVRDLVGLRVGLLLRAAELFLGVALALLLLALAAQAGVVRQVARSLLRASGHFVHDAHVLCLLGGYVSLASVPRPASGQTGL